MKHVRGALYHPQSQGDIGPPGLYVPSCLSLTSDLDIYGTAKPRINKMPAPTSIVMGDSSDVMSGAGMLYPALHIGSAHKILVVTHLGGKAGNSSPRLASCHDGQGCCTRSFCLARLRFGVGVEEEWTPQCRGHSSGGIRPVVVWPTVFGVVCSR